MAQYTNYQEDQTTLARELRWMGIMLRRADIVPLEDKQMIERRLSMYDDLMEKDPKMQKLFADREARGEAKGEARGEARTLQRIILAVVQRRFPSLASLAQQRVQQLHTPDELDALFEQLEGIFDEQEARSLLATP